MELNLEKLNGLASSGQQENPPENQPAEAQKRLFSEGINWKGTIGQESPLKLEYGGLWELQKKADRNREEIERSKEAYRKYQENTKTSEQLQTELLKGVRTGENVYSLFLKAAKCISCMTANTAFYDQIDGDIRVIYGSGIQEEAPLQMMIQEAQDRLFKLREAEKRETAADSLQRIRWAIKAHENRISELRALLPGQLNKQERPA